MADSQPTAPAEAPSYVPVPDPNVFREALDSYVKARYDLNIAWMSFADNRVALREAADAAYLAAREVLWGLAGLTPPPWTTDEDA